MEIHIKVEQMPTFTKGSPNIWITKNVKYPLYAMQRKIEGKVYVGFIVNQDGLVSEVEIVRECIPPLIKRLFGSLKVCPIGIPAE